MKKMRIEAVDGGKGFSFWMFPDPETAFCFIDSGSKNYLPLMSRYRLHPGKFIEVEFCGFESGVLDDGTSKLFLNVRIIEPIHEMVKFNGMYILNEEVVTWVTSDEFTFADQTTQSYITTLIHDDESKIEVESWKPNEIEVMHLGSITNEC